MKTSLALLLLTALGAAFLFYVDKKESSARKEYNELLDRIRRGVKQQ